MLAAAAEHHRRVGALWRLIQRGPQVLPRMALGEQRHIGGHPGVLREPLHRCFYGLRDTLMPGSGELCVQGCDGALHRQIGSDSRRWHSNHRDVPRV